MNMFEWPPEARRMIKQEAQGEIRNYIVTHCHNLTEIIADIVKLHHTDDVGRRYTSCKVAEKYQFPNRS